MTILLVHVGTDTILDAGDGVYVVDTNELTSQQKEQLIEEEDTEIATEIGTDIMKVIRYYMGERK